ASRVVAGAPGAGYGAAAPGQARVQRAADPPALCAARSMRDALPRLPAPAALPDGSPNPRHLSRGEYFSRARLAALDAARHNRVDPARLRIGFPDVASTPPLQARVSVIAQIDPQGLPGGNRLADRPSIPVAASAVA